MSQGSSRPLVTVPLLASSSFGGVLILGEPWGLISFGITDDSHARKSRRRQDDLSALVRMHRSSTQKASHDQHADIGNLEHDSKREDRQAQRVEPSTTILQMGVDDIGRGSSVV